VSGAGSPTPGSPTPAEPPAAPADGRGRVIELWAERDAEAREAQRAITAVRRERDARTTARLRRDRALFEEPRAQPPRSRR
jgi:hypothetical protein